MKKHFLFSLLLLIIPVVVSTAQDMSVGILAGINFQNLNGKNSTGSKLEYSLATGFHGGVNIMIPIADEFNFQPGLLLSGKGSRNTDASPEVKYRLTYLELPLNLVYRGLLGKGYVLLGFGPYLGYAIGGKVKFDNGAKSDIEFKKVIEASDPETITYFKAFDAGANIFAGYEMENGIFLQLNTQLGLAKINPEDRRITNDESSVKNTGFGFSIGYRF